VTATMMPRVGGLDERHDRRAGSTRDSLTCRESAAHFLIPPSV
jgi:hypothetical protein